MSKLRNSNFQHASRMLSQVHDITDQYQQLHANWGTVTQHPCHRVSGCRGGTTGCAVTLNWCSIYITAALLTLPHLSPAPVNPRPAQDTPSRASSSRAKCRGLLLMALPCLHSVRGTTREPRIIGWGMKN